MLPPMTLYGTWLKPLLFTQDPESVHHRAMAGMRLGLASSPVRRLVAARQCIDHPALRISLPTAPGKSPIDIQFPGAVGPCRWL